MQTQWTGSCLCVLTPGKEKQKQIMKRKKKKDSKANVDIKLKTFEPAGEPV